MKFSEFPSEPDEDSTWPESNISNQISNFSRQIRIQLRFELKVGAVREFGFLRNFFQFNSLSFRLKLVFKVSSIKFRFFSDIIGSFIKTGNFDQHLNSSKIYGKNVLLDLKLLETAACFSPQTGVRTPQKPFKRLCQEIFRFR